MHSDILDILHTMQIPVFLPKKTKLAAAPAFVSPPVPMQARYALILGVIGQFEAQTQAIQQDQFNMIKRLIAALNWDFETCFIAQLDKDLESLEAFSNTLTKSNIEKMIVFGNDLENVAQKLRVSTTLEIMVIPSVEALMRDPNAKREAWGRLVPHKIL